jgi:acetyl-CoA carboxylase carboxyl transferase subunit alpha
MEYLSFEKPIEELEIQLIKAHELADETGVDMAKTVTDIRQKLDDAKKEIYSNLSAWERVQLSRHPQRPYTQAYIHSITEGEFIELHGDRGVKDDKAMIGGWGKIGDQTCMIIGQQKGVNTKMRQYRNFGMANPEGYRKAIRLMDLANRFGLPVISLVDTPGAYPGKGAEERGQSEAIARSTEKCLQLKVPLISIIIGEGGSGGAVAFATANKLVMLEHSIYSVISPEGCASILWKDAEKMREAAEALRLTAQDLIKLGVCDQIITEPTGGAHRDRAAAMHEVGQTIGGLLDKLGQSSPEKLMQDRRQKFLNMGKKGITA